MKTLLQNGYVILSARILLGFIFVVASIEKIADPNAFAVSISYYRILGEPLTLIIATVLPWVELLCGMFLLLGIMMRGSSLLVLLMLVVFTAGVISGILRDLDISCGCFTQDPNVDKIGWAKVLENLGMILFSFLLYFSRSDRFSILTFHQPYSDTTDGKP